MGQIYIWPIGRILPDSALVSKSALFDMAGLNPPVKVDFSPLLPKSGQILIWPENWQSQFSAPIGSCKKQRFLHVLFFVKKQNYEIFAQQKSSFVLILATAKITKIATKWQFTMGVKIVF